MKVEILVVDDEILQLQLLSKIIQRYRPEFTVTAVNQPREALKLLRTGRYNALLTDVKMPEMDGIELIRHARALNLQPLEILILSGFDDFEYARSAIVYDVLDYLLKPIDGASLQSALMKLEDKLRADYAELDLRRQHDQMLRSRHATALMKKAMGLPLTAREQDLAQQFGNHVRMLLTQECADPDALLAALPPSSCAGEWKPGHILFFMPAAREVPTHPTGAGRLIVGLPASLDQLPARLMEMEALLDTAARLGVSTLTQEPPDPSLTDAFARAMLDRSRPELERLAALIHQSMFSGRLSYRQLMQTARQALETLIRSGSLRQVYPCREEDLHALLLQSMEACGTPQELCAAVADAVAPVNVPAEDDRSFAQSVRIYIDAHYGAACSLNEIAQAFHYSPSHFSRLFSVAFGVTYTRYLADFRLEKARELLMQTDLPVNEIARRVGISDTGYLIRQFSRKYQLSPDKYRRRGGK